MSTLKRDKGEELFYNPGEIVEINGWHKWFTRVGNFDLALDIISAGHLENGETELGIASFVVMEQKQTFLDYVSFLLAEEIARQAKDNNLHLVTVESKGSHFVSRVWDKLAVKIGNKLNDRIITVRKGAAKVYMKRPIVFDDQEIAPVKVEFHSITSPEKQILRVSPLDVEQLKRNQIEGTIFIMVDDFIGRGGTAVAVYQLFRELDLTPPQLLVVVGSDGSLYRNTFAKEKIDIALLPQPLPLLLPTFKRSHSLENWQINR